MARWNPLVPLLLAWMSTCLPGASAADLVPVVASASVCLIMFFVVVSMAVFLFIWPDLKKAWIRRNGKVKIPRAYYRKREEAKKALINGSVVSRTPSSHNFPLQNKTTDTASWVQDWHQETPQYNNVFEEQDITIELEDEKDKEFQIETYVVDNEVLDVGPYKDTALTTSAQPAIGTVYSDPYIYVTGDRVTTTITKSSEATGGMVSSISHGSEMREDANSSLVAEEQASVLNDNLVKL